MFRIAIMTGILLAAASSAWSQGTNAAAGEKVYADQKCSVCHSVAGKGNQKGALDDVGLKLTGEEIRMWITDAKAMTAKIKAVRKPPMREYNLPKDQVDALVAYLSTLKKK
jgi:mono/diheme cytochrome c family protein